MAIDDYREVEYEAALYRMLDRIKMEGGMWIGTPSLNRLFQFINGYQAAIQDITGYKPHFDKEFQLYLQAKNEDAKRIRWNILLSKQRTDEEAFYAFYEEFEDYRKQHKGTLPSCR